MSALQRGVLKAATLRRPNSRLTRVALSNVLLKRCSKGTSTLCRNKNGSFPNPDYVEIGPLASKHVQLNDIQVFEKFVSDKDEKALLDELEPYLKRLRYEFDHWDNAIHGYRETEKSNWNEANKEIILKMQKLAFGSGASVLRHVHVLDISKEGFIKPHVDSVKFCGDTIVGISLLSDSVMRLVNEKNPNDALNVFLPRQSLYLMKNAIRYEYNHEILKHEESYFKGEHVPRDRRISVICRNEPTTSD